LQTMKKTISAAAWAATLSLSVAGAVSSLLLASPAVAADYIGVDSEFMGVRGVSWKVNIIPCLAELEAQYQGQVFLVTIDNVVYTTSFAEVGYSSGPEGPGTIRFSGTPLTGTLQKVTIGGASQLTCGADRLLLPNAVAPAPVPTLSEWAMILLGVLLAGGAALTIQRRRAV